MSKRILSSPIELEKKTCFLLERCRLRRESLRYFDKGLSMGEGKPTSGKNPRGPEWEHLGTLTQLLSSVLQPQVCLDSGSNILFANDAFARIFSEMAADLSGFSLSTCFNPADFTQIAPYIRQAQAGKDCSVSLLLKAFGDRFIQVNIIALGLKEAGAPILLLSFIEPSQDSVHELKKSYERYHSFIEQSSEGIWRFELEQALPIQLPFEAQIEIMLEHGYLAECNDAMARMYGYKKSSDLVGAKLKQLFIPEDEKNQTFLKEFIRSKYHLTDIESLEVDRYGRRLHFRNNLIGHVEGACLVRVWGVQRDITEEVSAREELRRSEQRLRMATKAGKVGIWEWNIASNALFWSELVKDVYGLDLDQTPSMADFRSKIYPDDREFTRQRIEQALDPKNTEPYISQHRIIVNGMVKWVQGFGEVVFDEKQVPILMSGTVIDITEQKNAEEKAIQLNEAGRAFAKAVSLADVTEVIDHYAFAVMGASAMAVYEMRAGQLELFHAKGYPASTLSYLSSLSPETRLPFADAGFSGRALYLDSPDELRRLYPHLCHEGAPRRSMCGLPLIANDLVVGLLGLSFNEQKNFDPDSRRFVETFSDLCAQALERARLYEGERRARREAEAANQAKSRFLANMSHEIRTPLGAILGFTELLSDPQMSPSDRCENIEIILRNGRALEKIINDILDLSKIESERLEIESIDFELIPLVKEVIELLRLKFQEKGLSLSLTEEGHLPRQIKADSTRLRQILLNLLGNAIRFTPRGQVELKVAAVAAGDSLLLKFSCTDSGVGIEPENFEKIFEPFVQADSSTTRKFGGSGLGLAVSRSLARAMGGNLCLQWSEPGKGSCFVLTMQAQLSRPRNAPLTRPTAPAQNRELEGIRVLVVDDGLDNLVLIRRFLQHAGATVKTASAGLEALEMAFHEEFDLVLSDIQMPEMDGFELLRRLRERAYARPLIALTAHAMAGDRELSFQHGFAEHLVKPIDRLALIAAVKTHAARHAREP